MIDGTFTDGRSKGEESLEEDESLDGNSNNEM
jgi:hypothetical protein